MKIKKIVGSFLYSILLVLSVITINKGYTKVNAASDVTVTISKTDFSTGQGISTSNTGTITKTIASTGDLTLSYSEVSYADNISISAGGYFCSNNCPEGYYPSKVVIKPQSKHSSLASLKVDFSSTETGTSSYSKTCSGSQPTSYSFPNSDQSKINWKFSVEESMASIESIAITYSPFDDVSTIDSYMQLSYSYDCSNVRTTDTLTIEDLGISSTSYTQFENKNFNCGTYTGLAACDNGLIQMDGEEGSFITTSSNGRISKLSVVYGGTNTDKRTINIYGSNTAYTSLYSSYDDTLIGTITYSTDDTSGSVVLNGDYKYVRLVTSDKMYFESISLEWITASTYSDSNFVFRCAVDSGIKDLLEENSITDYGIYVKCNTSDDDANANEVYFSYNDSEGLFNETSDGKLYIIIKLGDLLNAIDRVSYEFTVQAYVVVDSTIKISAKSKTYSVASAINEYHGNETYKNQVADLYGYLVVNGKIA